MAVLVTGGAGYIGSHMVWALLDAGQDVVVLDRLSTGFRWAVAPEARFYEGDIADEAMHEKVFGENNIDAIIHFAGSIIVPESVTNPLMYYENNTAKSRALIANCGYGLGFSVLEVLETVKKVHGKPFEIRYAGRRAGDAVMIVANPAVARQELNWQPQYDNLEFIVETALAWEDHLSKRNDR